MLPQGNVSGTALICFDLIWDLVGVGWDCSRSPTHLVSPPRTELCPWTLIMYLNSCSREWGLSLQAVARTGPGFVLGLGRMQPQLQMGVCDPELDAHEVRSSPPEGSPVEGRIWQVLGGDLEPFPGAFNRTQKTRR